MAIVEALAAISQAISVGNAMRAVEKNFDAAAYKVQLADLMIALADARIELIAARDASTEQTAEIDRLRKALDERAELVEARGGFKYKADNEGKPSGYPVCPSCELKNGRIVYLVNDGNVRKGRCPVCDARFEGITVYRTTPQEEPDTLEAQQSRQQAESIERASRQMRSARHRWP